MLFLILTCSPDGKIFDASAEPSNLAEQVKRDSERVWPPVLMDWQPGLGLPAGVVGRAGRRGGRDTSPVPSTSSVSSAAPVAAPRRGSVAISVPAAVGYTSTTTVAGSVPPSEAGEELPLLSYCSSTLTTVGAALVGGVESVVAGLSGGIINTGGAESVEPKPEPEPKPDHDLKRWVNWQLRKASNDLQLRDFGLDLKVCLLFNYMIFEIRIIFFRIWIFTSHHRHHHSGDCVSPVRILMYTFHCC